MPVSEPRKGPVDVVPKAREGGRLMKVSAEEQALVRLYRSLSFENQRNVIRYVDAVRDIETMFKRAPAADSR